MVFISFFSLAGEWHIYIMSLTLWFTETWNQGLELAAFANMRSFFVWSNITFQLLETFFWWILLPTIWKLEILVLVRSSKLGMLMMYTRWLEKQEAVSFRSYHFWAHSLEFILTNGYGSINLDRYMAPEVFKHRRYDKKVDIFSFAMILYEVILLPKNRNLH
jgi:serine/threonine protein kinase